MKQLFIYLLFLFGIALAACNTEEPVYEDLNGFENLNRTIKFDVYHVYDLSPVADSSVSGASIKIYAAYEDLLLDYYPDASRITDSLGYAEINGLGEDYYYIKCTHPELGEVIDSVSTPSNTISFVELYFY